VGIPLSGWLLIIAVPDHGVTPCEPLNRETVALGLFTFTVMGILIEAAPPKS